MGERTRLLEEMRAKYEAAEEARKREAEARHEELMAERRRVLEVRIHFHRAICVRATC